VDDLLHSYSGIEKGDIKPSLALYHFTNFGASPNIVIYELPTTVFSFYSACQSALKVDWQPFLMSHYTNSKHKGAHYNPATSAYEIVKKNETERIEFESYKTWRNRVLEDLLNGNSLLGKFKRWGISHRFNFEIVEIYQKYIQNMKQETLEKIKELALFLTDTDEDAIKKHIRALDGSKSAYELRRFFLKKVVVKNYNNGAEKPKITLDEWVNYLFSDDIAWRDVRDVLLVAIYQKLHEKNIRVEVPEAEALEDDNIEDQQ
jgi:CRISPR-associated protein Cst1